MKILLIYIFTSGVIKGSWSEECLFELKSGTLESQIGVDEYGLSTYQFTLDRGENVYIYDRYNSSIKKFSKSGKFITELQIPRNFEIWGMITLSQYLYVVYKVDKAGKDIYSLRRYSSSLEKEKILSEDTVEIGKCSDLMVYFY